MADEAEEQEADSEKPLAGAAAQSALQKERKDNKELKARIRTLEETEQKRLTEAQSDRDKAENAKKSEFQQLQDQINALTTERDQERTQRDAERTARDRADRVRKAAGKFADPEDVVALLRGRDELDGIADDADAERILAQLAADKPHLLKPAGIEPSGLEQVLQNGHPQFPKDTSNGVFTPADRSAIVPFDALNKMNSDQLKELQARDPGLYERSMNALSGYGPDGMKIVVQ